MFRAPPSEKSDLLQHTVPADSSVSKCAYAMKSGEFAMLIDGIKARRSCSYWCDGGPSPASHTGRLVSFVADELV